MHKITLTLSLALIACGGAKDSVKPTHAHEQHEHHEGHHEGHAHGAEGSSVAKFHARLAPLWHAPEGDKRIEDTCAAAPELHALGSEIVVEAGSKEPASEDYVSRAKSLEASASALRDECGKPERAEFSNRFTTLHEAFHALAEANPEHGHGHEHGHE